MTDNVRVPELAPVEVVRLCKSHHEAIRLCVQLSGLKQDYVAEQLGVDKSNFSRMLSGNRTFPDAKLVQLYLLCGNLAPLQWQNETLGFSMVPRWLAERLGLGAAGDISLRPGRGM